jgi:hypothetical protein
MKASEGGESVRSDGQEVTRTRSTTSASTSSQGPWQIAPIGLPASDLVPGRRAGRERISDRGAGAAP